MLSVSYKLFERLLLRGLESVFDYQLPDKQAGFRHSECITDRAFELIYDVEHRFEENKPDIVLADLTAAAHDSLLYGTKPKHPTTVFELVLFLLTKL